MSKIVVVPGPTRTEYVTKNVNITEKRAPTDESVRLLSEMERAAEAKVVAGMKMEGNALSGVVLHWESPVDQQRHVKAVFDLNGRRIEVLHNDWVDAERVEMLVTLRDKIAQRIASEFLTETLRGIRWER